VLVAFYLPEERTAEVHASVVRQPGMPVTSLHQAEWAHAVAAHVHRKDIDRRQALAVEAAFASDCRAGVWVPMALPDMAWQVCSGLAWQFGPRLPICTLDSLHVAAALVLHADRFWTFDQRQARLARAAGLTTVGIV